MGVVDDPSEPGLLLLRLGRVEEGGSGGCRKKLRLTREQSAVLEDKFNEHSTLLNPKQKLALAKQLNLRPRQVEVWFQNRRARTKLKKTEVDCEFLRRRCETLAEENRRLHGDLQELRSLKLAAVTPLHASMLMMCPSCEGVALGETDDVAMVRASPPLMKDTMKKKTLCS
ncbi:homeobox-leucine zipper protein HOX15-like [Phalaenopsis equestris]|uniref:homeobox-leucine zipper protein HOX15-like n=1 Tax=Phalaenopsis equestris TaxID=78828 RepID=UPI0009E3B842|nr:homeobox-leucine zipper protein HOX15-like [Phalaenopsis equestris]